MRTEPSGVHGLQVSPGGVHGVGSGDERVGVGELAG